MKTNMGSVDKTIRILIAIAVGVLVFTEVLTGTLALIATALAAVFVLTSIFSFCPIYRIFGLSTCKNKV